MMTGNATGNLLQLGCTFAGHYRRFAHCCFSCSDLSINLHQVFNYRKGRWCATTVYILGGVVLCGAGGCRGGSRFGLLSGRLSLLVDESFGGDLRR
jgi:hypothetical protein